MRKKIVFSSNGCCTLNIYLEKLNFNHYHTLHIKINLKWLIVTDKNVKLGNFWKKP